MHETTRHQDNCFLTLTYHQEHLPADGSLTLLAGCADETYPDHVERVYLQLTPLMRTKDFREGVQSYLEKRPPKFTGN